MVQADHEAIEVGGLSEGGIAPGMSPLLDCYILIILTHIYRVPSTTKRDQLHRRFGAPLSDISRYGSERG